MAGATTGKALRRGGVGAMMDEYERAAAELAGILRGITDEEFERIRDRGTEDEDCRSIQTVMRHVVRAGYGYATYIRNAFGDPAERPTIPPAKRLEVLEQLDAALAYMATVLDGKWELPDREIQALRINAPWGPAYDLEQMLEHAIVHVLRHRRQVERFLTEPQFSGRAD